MSRRTIYRLHKWLGLMAGLPLLLISLSGSLLVFRLPPDRLTRPAIFRLQPEGTRASWTTLIANARARYPGARLANADLCTGADEPVRLSVERPSGPLVVYLHPYTGAVLGDDREYPPASQLIYALHTRLFLGRGGEIVVVVMGMALTLLALSGLFVYRGVWLHPFRIRRTRRGWWRVADLHRVAGLWSLLLLVIFGVTGVWLNHEVLLPRPAAGAAAVGGPGPQFDLGILIDRSEAALPGFHPASVVFPEDGSTTLTLYGSSRMEPLSFFYGNYGSSMRVDGASAAIRNVSTPGKQSVAEKLSNLVYLVHSGDYAMGMGAWLVWSAYSVAGLSPGLLAVSGFVLWKKQGARRLDG